ncbi:MAG: hypothetical protein ACKPE9_15565 [Planktothrix sp.]
MKMGLTETHNPQGVIMTGLELTIFIVGPLVSFLFAIALTPNKTEIVSDQEHSHI